jgi:HEAT repeat protein
LSIDSFAKNLIELGDENRPVIPSKLANVSTVSSEELLLFLDAWVNMGFERRRQIVHYLVDLAEEEPKLNFDAIFQACLYDPDEIVRVRAIEGLWEYENNSIIDRFITMLKEDWQESVRAAAAQALGRFALLAELGKLRPDDRAKVEESLITTIDDQEEGPEVRRRAIEAIAPLSLPKVAEIIQIAYNSEDNEIRVSAIYAMGRNSDPVWLPTLLKELGNPDTEMRFEAAVACGEIGEEEAVPHLMELIHDLDTQVQQSAIAALGIIGGSEAEAALGECLNHPEAHIRAAAEDALEDLGLGKDPISFRII